MKLNTILFSLFIIALLLVNEFTWLIFFDQDGFLKFSKQLAFGILDLFFSFSAIYFFLKRNTGRSAVIDYIKIVSVNIVGFAFSIILFELLFGNWYSSWNSILFGNRNIYLKRNVHYIFNVDNFYENNSKKITYKRDNKGFRGKYDKVENINIITLGGSTTDQRYIDEGLTWQDIIHNRFEVEGKNIFIVNAGIDGQSTYGHIMAIKYWLSDFSKLKPDYYLFYLGVNDVYRDTIDNYPRDNFILDEKFNDKSIYEKSAIWQLKIILDSIFDYRVRNILNHGAMINSDEFSWADKGKLKNYDFLSPYLIKYKDRLEILNELVVLNGSKAIFVNNTSNVFKKNKHWDIIGRDIEIIYKGRSINGVDLGYIYESFHTTLEKFCQENNILFINLVSELELDLKNDYYDSVHNTPSGSRKIGDYLYSKIKDYY